jgi:Chromo (CHRromatin Organisation MOdifier) domain
MVTDYLGPGVQRTGSVGATLNALRVRLETDEVTDDRHVDLCWQVREAIRTEFFKIKYPAPPSLRLLGLVTGTEILLTAYTAPTRPFFFPGARVSAPHENNVDRRAGTTLQLRYKLVENTNITEALLHLDGEKGGGFRWVQTTALIALDTAPLPVHSQNFAPLPPPTTNYLAPRASKASNASVATSNLAGNSAATLHARQQQLLAQHQHQQHQLQQLQSQQQLLKQQQLHARAIALHQQQLQQQHQQKVEARLAKQRKDEARAAARVPPPVQSSVDILPPSFVPDALRVTSPPPRKRLRPSGAPRIFCASGSVDVTAAALRAVAMGRSPMYPPDILSATGDDDRPFDHAGDTKDVAQAAREAIDGEHIHVNVGSSSTLDAGTIIAVAESDPIPSVSTAPIVTATSFAAGSAIAPASDVPPHAPRCLAALTSRVLVIDRLVARRENVSAGGVVEYFVKWAGVSWDRCTWESREALIEDTPGLVLDFDIRHPQAPSRVWGESREPPPGEQDIQQKRYETMKGNEEADREEVAENKRLEDAPVLIPTWFEAPLVEIGFSGLVLHVRRNEGALFNDSAAASRDLKRRRARFKTEYPDQARRLFVPTRTEVIAKERSDAKSLIEASIRTHKLHGNIPIYFPRALGTVLRTELFAPVPRYEINAAPPSWESYLMNLGLECTDWGRENTPDMPTADAAVKRNGKIGTAREPSGWSTTKQTGKRQWGRSGVLEDMVAGRSGRRRR